jgi:simple sugar transport system ATP-binding protein
MPGKLVEMKGIVKAYGSVVALDNVDFEVGENEIVGLVGDNGAGKSTLIKILSGVYKPNAGEIVFRGKSVQFESTRDAIDQGIETIYQDSALVPQLSIDRNLFLGREPVNSIGPFKRLDKEYMQARSRELLQQVGISKNINPKTPITSLSGGERQSISIARAIFFEADLIILDEPTNNLGVEESRGVLKFIKSAKERGHSSIFITHNIHHIYQVVDRIVILRNGKKVGDIRTEDTSVDHITDLITGEVSE